MTRRTGPSRPGQRVQRIHAHVAQRPPPRAKNGAGSDGYPPHGGTPPHPRPRARCTGPIAPAVEQLLRMQHLRKQHHARRADHRAPAAAAAALRIAPRILRRSMPAASRYTRVCQLPARPASLQVQLNRRQIQHDISCGLAQHRAVIRVPARAVRSAMARARAGVRPATSTISARSAMRCHSGK